MCKTYTKEWIFLNEKKRLNIKGAILDKAQLENYLEKIASDHILTEKSSKETYPLPRLKENFFVIKEVYKLLNEQIKQSIQIHPAGEWILDNLYIIEEVVKSKQGKIVGKAMLPTERSGKVKKGQKVNIRFSNYPDKEFGIMKGIVENISLIPVLDVQNAKSYMVDIELPNGLRTSYNKDLPFLPEMEGQADIITEDISLLERFLMPIRKVITEGLKSEDM